MTQHAFQHQSFRRKRRRANHRHAKAAQPHNDFAEVRIQRSVKVGVLLSFHSICFRLHRARRSARPPWSSALRRSRDLSARKAKRLFEGTLFGAGVKENQRDTRHFGWSPKEETRPCEHPTFGPVKAFEGLWVRVLQSRGRTFQ